MEIGKRLAGYWGWEERKSKNYFCPSSAHLAGDRI